MIIQPFSRDLNDAISLIEGYELTDFERLTIAAKLMEVDEMQQQSRIARGTDYNENIGNVARAINNLASKIK